MGTLPVRGRLGSEVSRYLDRGDELGVAGWAFAGLAALELKMPELARSAEGRIRSYIRPGSQTVDLADTRGGKANGGILEFRFGTLRPGLDALPDPPLLGTI